MAAHQSIVVSICTKIKGVPTNRGNGTASSMRAGRVVIPAGTPGIVYQTEAQNAWDTGGKIYHFYPANFTETLDSTFMSDSDKKAKIVVLAETVEYHQNTGEVDGPVAYISIVESGYTRISALQNLGPSAAPKARAR